MKIYSTKIIAQEIIENKILIIRSKKVMVDRDLAQLYNVPTKILNQAVKRNIKRFPSDFMFQLTRLETRELVTNCDRFASLKHSTSLPRVFTENGILMLSSVLNSERAILVNIEIMRTFTRIREMLNVHADLKQKIEMIEQKYDRQFFIVFKTIKKLLDPPPKPKNPIGFHPFK